MVSALLFAIVLIGVYGQTCPTYECEDYFAYSDACMTYDSSTNTYYTLSCLCDGHYPRSVAECDCQPDGPQGNQCAFELKDNGVKTKFPPKLYTSGPGLTCTSDDQCFGSDCVAGKCKGSALGEDCVTNYNCNPGLYCDYTQGNYDSGAKCANLKGENSSCRTRFECKAEMGCIDGLCETYFKKSLNSVCTDNADCASGNCFLFQCEPAFVSKTVGNECLDDTYCTSAEQSIGGILFDMPGKCSCGRNAEGQSYCMPFLGDNVGQDLFNMEKNILQNPNKVIALCNTYDRYSRYCLREFLSDEAYALYIVYLWKYHYFAQVGHDGTELEGCVDQTFAFEYYAATWNPGDHDDTDDDNDDQDDDNPFKPDFDDDLDDDYSDFAAALIVGAFALLL